MNVRKWVNDYYSIYKKLDLKDGTLRSYLTTLCRIPADWEVEYLTSADVQKLVNELSEKLSASTVRHIFMCLRSAIIAGRDYGLPDKSAAVSGIRLPKASRKIVKAFCSAELEALESVFSRSFYGDIFVFLLNTGMRIGELIAIDCDDVNFVKRTVRIEKSFYRGKIVTTKTQNSVREVPLNDKALNVALNAYRLGSSKMPLFRSKKGDRLSYNTIINNWHFVLDCANLERCGVHTLRHTFATLMLERDVPLKIVSQILGHKSISITADIYTDVPLFKMLEAVNLLKIDKKCTYPQCIINA